LALEDKHQNAAAFLGPLPERGSCSKHHLHQRGRREMTLTRSKPTNAAAPGPNPHDSSWNILCLSVSQLCHQLLANWAFTTQRDVQTAQEHLLSGVINGWYPSPAWLFLIPMVFDSSDCVG